MRVRAVAAGQFRYDPLFNNSNAAAHEFLEGAGLPIDKPGGWAPGWGHNLIDN